MCKCSGPCGREIDCAECKWCGLGADCDSGKMLDPICEACAEEEFAKLTPEEREASQLLNLKSSLAEDIRAAIKPAREWKADHPEPTRWHLKQARVRARREESKFHGFTGKVDIYGLKIFGGDTVQGLDNDGTQQRGKVYLCEGEWCFRYFPLDQWSRLEIIEEVRE